MNSGYRVRVALAEDWLTFRKSDVKPEYYSTTTSSRSDSLKSFSK